MPLSSSDQPSHFVYNELLVGSATDDKSTFVDVRNIDIAPCSGYPEHEQHQQQHQSYSGVHKPVTESTSCDVNQANHEKVDNPVRVMDKQQQPASTPPASSSPPASKGAIMDKQPSASKLVNNSKTQLTPRVDLVKTSSDTKNPFWADLQSPKTSEAPLQGQCYAKSTSSKTSVPGVKKSQSKEVSSHHSLHANQTQAPPPQQPEKRPEGEHHTVTDQTPPLPAPPPSQRKLKKVKRAFPMCCMTDVVEDTSGPPPPLPAPPASVSAQDEANEPGHESAPAKDAAEHPKPESNNQQQQLQADVGKLTVYSVTCQPPDNLRNSRSMLEENNTWDATSHTNKLQAKCTPDEIPDVKERVTPSATRLRPSQELVAVGTTNKAMPSSRQSLPISVSGHVPQRGSRPSSATHQQALSGGDRRGSSNPRVAADTGGSQRHNQSSPARLIKDEIENKDGGVTLHYQPDTSALGFKAPKVEHTVEIKDTNFKASDDKKEEPGTAGKQRHPPPTPPPSVSSKQDTIKIEQCQGDKKAAEEKNKHDGEEDEIKPSDSDKASLRWEMKAMKGKTETDGLTIDYAMKASYDAKTGDVESSATVTAQPKPNNRVQVCSTVQATMKLKSKNATEKEPLEKISEIFSPLMSPTPQTAPIECSTRPASLEAVSPTLSPFNSRSNSPQLPVDRPESPSSPLPVDTQQPPLSGERDLFSPPCKRRIVSNVAAVYVCACPYQPCYYHQDGPGGPAVDRGAQGCSGPDVHHSMHPRHPHSHCHTNTICASATVRQTTTEYDDNTDYDDGCRIPTTFHADHDSCHVYPHNTYQLHNHLQQPQQPIAVDYHRDLAVKEESRGHPNTQTTSRRPPLSQHLYQNAPMQASHSNFTVDSQKYGVTNPSASACDNKTAHLHQHADGSLCQQPHLYSPHHPLQQQQQQPGCAGSSHGRTAPSGPNAKPQSCTGQYQGAGMNDAASNNVNLTVGLPAGMQTKPGGQHQLFPDQQAYAVLNRTGSRIGYFITAEATSTEDGENAEAHAFINQVATSVPGEPGDRCHQMFDGGLMPAAPLMMDFPQQWSRHPHPQQMPFVCFEPKFSQPCHSIPPVSGHRVVPVDKKASSGSTAVNQKQSQTLVPCTTRNNASTVISRQPSHAGAGVPSRETSYVSGGVLSRQSSHTTGSIPSGRFTTADMYSKPWTCGDGRPSMQSQQSQPQSQVMYGISSKQSSQSHATSGVLSGKLTTADTYSRPWTSEGGRPSQQSQTQQQQEQVQGSDDTASKRQAKSQHSARASDSSHGGQGVTRSIHGPHVGSATAAMTSTSQQHQQPHQVDGLMFSNQSSKQQSLERCSSTKSPSQ